MFDHSHVAFDIEARGTAESQREAVGMQVVDGPVGGAAGVELGMYAPEHRGPVGNVGHGNGGAGLDEGAVLYGVSVIVHLAPAVVGDEGGEGDVRFGGLDEEVVDTNLLWRYMHGGADLVDFEAGTFFGREGDKAGGDVVVDDMDILDAGTYVIEFHVWNLDTVGVYRLAVVGEVHAVVDMVENHGTCVDGEGLAGVRGLGLVGCVTVDDELQVSEVPVRDGVVDGLEMVVGIGKVEAVEVEGADVEAALVDVAFPEGEMAET